MGGGCGCCGGSVSGQTTAATLTIHSVAPKHKIWKRETADELQEAVDHIFKGDANELSSFEFSLTLADPKLPDCPLVGCSTGFTKLVAYSMDEIVGRNRRFLIDPVPPHKINNKVRRQAKDFCEAIARGEDYKLSNEDTGTGRQTLHSWLTNRVKWKCRGGGGGGGKEGLPTA